MSGNKRNMFIVGAVVVVVLVIVLYIATREGPGGPATPGMPSAEEVARMYPKPQELFELSGTLKGIYGTILHLEITDPLDTVPHADGSPRNTEVRVVLLRTDTKITLVNTTKLDTNGNPTITVIKLSDLAVGDAVTVKSSEDILSAKTFAATEIRKVVY